MPRLARALVALAVIRRDVLAFALVLALAGLLALPAAALEIRREVSPGGVPFWLVEEPAIPIVALEIAFEGGARLDPAEQAGRANLMVSLLDEGAGARDAQAFARARDDLSARFFFAAGSDTVEVSARFLAETLEPAAALLADALARPRFDAEPIERVRGQILSGIASAETSPGSVAARAWYARAFPDHPYGRPTSGTAETVARLARADLDAAHAQLLTRASARIGIVGAIDAAAAGRLIDRLLADLPAGDPPVQDPAPPPPPPPPGTEVIDLDVPQSVALFGAAGIQRSDPDFIPAFVVTHVLGGGGFGSRLTAEVREARGLAYGVGVSMTGFDEAALLVGRVQTQNDRMGETLALVRSEWARIGRDGVTAAELEAAKRYLTGAFPLQFDSNGKIAGYLVFLQREGLTPAYLEERNRLIEAVSLEDAARAARRLYDADALSIVVVGRPAGL